MLNENEKSFLSLVPNSNEDHKKAIDICNVLNITTTECEHICVNLETLNKIELIKQTNYGNPVYWVRKNSEIQNSDVNINLQINNKFSKSEVNIQSSQNNSPNTLNKPQQKSDTISQIIKWLKGVFVINSVIAVICIIAKVFS